MPSKAKFFVHGNEVTEEQYAKVLKLLKGHKP